MSRPGPVWVTGGAGFIGAHLALTLLGAGERVVVIDSLTYAGRRERLSAALDRRELELVVADVRDRARLTALARLAPPSLIYHLAAETHVDRSLDHPDEFLGTNVGGTLALLEVMLAEARDSRLVLVSTDEVLGPTPHGALFDERAPYDPKSPYAASKASAEMFARAYRASFELDVVIARPTNVFGPGQLPEKLIPLMIVRALSRLPLPVYGDGEHERDWLFVTDAVRGLRLVAAHAEPGEIFHLAGRSPKTTLDVVRAVCRELEQRRPELGDLTALITHVEDRPGHDRRYGLSGAALAARAGFAPEVEFSAGLALLVDELLAHPDLTSEYRHVARKGLSRSGRG